MADAMVSASSVRSRPRKDSQTAAFGSLFVFDTCKPSELRNALNLDNEETQDASSLDTSSILEGNSENSSITSIDSSSSTERPVPRYSMFVKSPFDEYGTTSSVQQNMFDPTPIGPMRVDTPVPSNFQIQQGALPSNGAPRSEFVSSNNSPFKPAASTVEEFDYQADVLDSLIDELDVSTIVEDDQGQTDWLKTEAFGSFQMAPEWYEITMSLAASDAENSSADPLAFLMDLTSSSSLSPSSSSNILNNEAPSNLASSESRGSNINTQPLNSNTESQVSSREGTQTPVSSIGKPNFLPPTPGTLPLPFAKSPTTQSSKTPQAPTITPLSASPGMGEKTIVTGAFVYRLSNIIDVDRPFDCILHDPDALDKSNPVALLSPILAVPPSAAVGKEPPSFTINIVVLGNWKNAHEVIFGTGANSKASLSAFLSSLESESSSISPPTTMASSMVAPLVVSKPKRGGFTSDNSTSNISPNVMSLVSKPPLKWTPTGTSLNFTQFGNSVNRPLVLSATVAIVNPQGKAKRTVKITVLAMALPNSVPSIPSNISHQLSNRTGKIVRSETRLSPCEPNLACILSAVSSSNAVLTFVPSLDSENITYDEFVFTLQTLQRIDYHSGTPTGNPQIRALVLPQETSTLQPTDPSYHLIHNVAKSWGISQTMTILLNPSENNNTPVKTLNWDLNPLVGHLCAQIHVLRMDTLMKHFDSKTNFQSKPTQPSVVTKASTTVGDPKSPTLKTPSFTPSNATTPPLKRIVAVIGKPGSGRSSFIRRACHARSSKLLPSEASSSLMSTFNSSTMGTYNSSMMGTYNNANNTQIANIADVFFGTERCLVEFIETPTREDQKIQFLKDINRANAFVFLYGSVHPSPKEVIEMHSSILDVVQVKSYNSQNQNRLPMTNKNTAIGRPAAQSRTITVNDIPILIVGTQAPPKDLTEAQLNLIKLQTSNSELTTPITDTSMMTINQLQKKFNIVHFSIDTQPVHHPELGKALQWLYNSIGERTMLLKGIKATNRPHRSGSMGLPMKSGSGTVPPVNSANSPTGSLKLPNSASSPNFGPPSFTGGRFSSSSPLSTPDPRPKTQVVTRPNTDSGNPNGISTRASVQLYLQVEQLVGQMRKGNSEISQNLPQSRPLPIQDRRLDTATHTYSIVPGTLLNSNNNGKFTSSGDEDSGSVSSSSSSKKKIVCKCFTGSEALDWMIECHLKPEASKSRMQTANQNSGSRGALASIIVPESTLRSQAITLLQQLLDLGVFRRLNGEDRQQFGTEPETLYRFQMDEDNETILNLRKVWIGSVDYLETETLAQWIYTRIPNFLIQNKSSSDFLLDVEKIRTSAIFHEFCLLTAKLQRVTLSQMTYAQSVAFWINTYNILSIHAVIVHGFPFKSKSKRKVVYAKSHYQIDGHVLSLDDILHGILRGNKKNPYVGKVPFKPNDPRLKIVLQHQNNVIDSRIFCCLTTMTASSPFITTMKSDTLDTQLDLLTSLYLAQELDVNFKNSLVVIPHLFGLYKTDFAKSSSNLLNIFAKFVDMEKAKTLNYLASKLREKDIKVKSEDLTPAAPRFKS